MMILHHDQELFRNYVALASESLGIDESIIVKDYFVTKALKTIFDYHQNAVFIGGTSLSKCFGIIERFSEDIDIAVHIESRKGKQKETSRIIETLNKLWEYEIENLNSQTSDFKEVYLNYVITNKSELDERVKLELVTFLDPFPNVKVIVSSYINNYLDTNEIERYQMQPFEVVTQEPHRTFFEKILLEKELFKNTLLDNELDESQEKRARDFYDIHKIWNYYGKSLPIENEQITKYINSRVKNRRGRTSITLTEINDYSLVDMFMIKKINKQLNETDRKKLSIRDLDTIEIENSLKEIDQFLYQAFGKS